MYDETKLPILRFYLASIENDENVNRLPNIVEDDLPDLCVPKRRTATAQTTSSSDLLSEAMQIAGISSNIEEDNPVI